MSWQRALTAFLDLYSESNLTSQWIIVGSVGSVLQQARMIPNDLDIYVRTMEDMQQLSALFKHYHLQSKSELSYYDPEWHSSEEEPYFTQTFSSGFTWTKGKWKVEGCSIEVVQISDSAGIPDSDTGEGIWEGGRYIWDLAKPIVFENRTIPVVPLEIQLESNLRRQRQDRADAIIEALLTHGCNRDILQRALSTTHYEKVSKILF
jgi:hypothetical protein